MAYSYIRYTGNGSTTNFAFSFPYLNQSDVKVFVNGAETSRTFLNANTVVVSPAPSNGAVVEIRRSSVTNTPPVDFADGSVLQESDLDLLAKFNLYTVQEAVDIARDTLTVAIDNTIDAGNRRITNVATPVNSGDAVNKQWAETGMTSQLTQAQALVAEAADLLNQAEIVISRFTISTSAPSGGNEGDVWFQVTA